MRMVVIDHDQKRLNKFVDWLIHMIGYALILIAASILFGNNFYIDNSYYGVWGLIAAVIIYVLNTTIKPILIFLTLPITVVTLGIFYPFINVFILKIVDFLLVDKFIIEGLFHSFLIAIFISMMNIIMREIIIKPMLERSSY